MTSTIFQLLASSVRLSTPLIFASLGGVISERAGVINIALEGMMLLGAFAAAVGTLVTGSPWLGAACGMMGGMLLALVHGLMSITLRANQVVAGAAINMLAFGLAPVICKLLYDVSGSTPGIPIEQRFQAAPIYLCWILVGLCWAWFQYSRSGLWVRVAGNNPAALHSAGIRVKGVRWMAVLASGALAGLGGACLSILLSSSFSRNMTAGRGFIALAAVVFGKWKPVPAAMACLLFGFAEAVQIRLQGTVLWGKDPVPVQFIQILPYVLTLLVLAGFVGRSRPPAALGIPLRGD